MNIFRSRVDVFEAINRCDWQKVKDAVVPGKANLRDGQYDATLLHWAVNEGHVPTVEHLLSCGADVRLRDGKHSATPLHWAAAKGHVFVVRLLMMQESDVNSRDASKRTPLHWAAGNGQLGVIRELLFWGARVECTDCWNKIPLHWAAFRGHVTSVEELVGRESPVDQADAEGNTPGSAFHQSVPEEARKAIRAAMKRGPSSGDSVVRAATVSSELLLETLRACRSWGELFENRHFDELSKECQDHRERLRGVIQGLADAGKAEGLEPCLRAMDLLNSALGLHEDMRNGTKPVPLKGGAGARSARGIGGIGGDGTGGRDSRNSSGARAPPRAGGEHRSSEDLRDFLAPGEAGPPAAAGGPTAEASGRGPGSSSAASLRLYQLPAVREACGGFDPKRCIGEGGFGKVYRGSMMGLPVAVKKLDETGLQGREQFFREVEVLSTCRHENIVPLLGVCMEPPCLVYRLMPNNSLRHHLDDPALRARLGWRLRVRTTMHMCSGLEYLHSDSHNKPKVIHGDIKPENILLDEYLKARLSDFGISRVGESEAGVPLRSSRAGGGRGARGGRGAAAGADAVDLQGTFGYMDPLYQSTGRLDERSDVYSMGVVMLELLTGDPVHNPEKSPPGLVDRVRKALDERLLKSVVDRSASWNKTAAKAYARLAVGCCAENPTARPTLREVLDKVGAILKNDEARTGSSSASTTDPSPSVDLLQLFDPIHNNISSNTANGNNGSSGGGDSSKGGGGVAEGGMPSSVNRASSDGPLLQKQNRPQPMRPQTPPPPPPYDKAIQNSTKTRSKGSEPPPYREAVAADANPVSVTSTGSLPAPSDRGVSNSPSLVSPGTRVTAGGTTEELVELSSAYDDGSTTADDGTGQKAAQPSTILSATGRAKPWWDAHNDSETTQATERGRAGGAGARSGGMAADQRHPPTSALLLVGGSISNDLVSSSRNGSISCTRSTSLSEYGVDLSGVLHAAMRGGVLSSNARLLCVCCAGPPPDGVDGEMGGAGGASGTGAAASSATLPPAEGTERGVGAKQDAGHVSVLDLWHRGRTVRYPAAADRAAMSPNQSESLIAVHGGGSLHVFSIPRRCRLQELAVTAELCMWRWLSPWGLALVTNNAVFYWSVSDSSAGGSPGNEAARGSGGVCGSERISEGAQDKDAAARLRRPRQAFTRRRTLTGPETLHRVYDYQASADGRWGMLLCAVADGDSGVSGPAGGGSSGYGSHSSSIEGGGGPVKVDLYSFGRETTFEFEVLGAALMTMPGSNPPLNILALVVRGEGGAAELRVLDLDRSLAQAADSEALNLLAEHGEGWLIATTHVIADEDLRGSAAYRMVDGGAQSAEARSLVSPPFFLRQWTENTNVLFLVGCHGLLLLLDVVTGAELARAQACVPPVVEAEVDADVGDLVVVSTADGGGVHRLTVRAAALRESVDYEHKDPEMATRVSASSGYGGVRPFSVTRRQG